MEANARLANAFGQGMSALKNSDYPKAVFYFRVSLNRHKKNTSAKANCMAFLGLCEVLGGLEDKISLIQDAHLLNPKDTNILKVLAYAYLSLGERKQGIATIILGLKVESDNPDLLAFLEQIGYRRKGSRGVIGLLNRTNKINQFLGRFFRKKKKSVSVLDILPVAA